MRGVNVISQDEHDFLLSQMKPPRNLKKSYQHVLNNVEWGPALPTSNWEITTESFSKDIYNATKLRDESVKQGTWETRVENPVMTDGHGRNVIGGESNITVSETKLGKGNMMKGRNNDEMNNISGGETVIMNKVSSKKAMSSKKSYLLVLNDGLWELKGGAAGDVHIPEMVKQAIRNGSRHGIQLEHGRENNGSGNCTFEGAIYNIQDRGEFLTDQKVNLDPKEARPLWVVEFQTWYEFNHPDFIEENIPEDLWDKLKKDEAYEINIVGDFLLPLISRGCKKNILVFNTSPQASDPIYVIQAGKHYSHSHPLSFQSPFPEFISSLLI